MKRIISISLITLFTIFILGYLECHAEENADYLTYSEIMLSSGKLMKNFTVEEKEEMYKHTEGVYWMNISVYVENVSVDGTYISNTLYSVDNTSQTSIEYTLDYTIETNNKVSFQTTDTLSGNIGFTKNKIKSELAAKATIDYSEVTTKSVKEKRNMKLEVEPNSRLIVYLTGDITITNGCFSVYCFWHRTYLGCFEFVTLKSQFSKLEKRSI